MPQKILITTSSFNLDIPEVETLKNAGYEIVLNPYGRRLTEEEAKEILTPDIVGMVAGVEPLTANVLGNTENLRVISRCGTGMDSVDLEAAKQKNIQVFNTPDAPAPAVAELTVGLMLDVLRGISLQDRSIRDGKWTRPVGNLLGERTIGIIGFGHIGKKVAKYTSGFGANIIAHDAFAAQPDDSNITFAELDHLLANADIISLHLPLNDDTYHLIDKARLEKMKPGAILINTSRGGLVDEQALLELLKKDHLVGAGLDVYEEEPYQGPLAKLDNVVLAAHTGSYAKEARIEQERQAIYNLIKGLEI